MSKVLTKEQLQKYVGYRSTEEQLNEGQYHVIDHHILIHEQEKVWCRVLVDILSEEEPQPVEVYIPTGEFDALPTVSDILAKLSVEVDT